MCPSSTPLPTLQGAWQRVIQYSNKCLLPSAYYANQAGAGATMENKREEEPALGLTFSIRWTTAHVFGTEPHATQSQLMERRLSWDSHLGSRAHLCSLCLESDLLILMDQFLTSIPARFCQTNQINGHSNPLNVKYSYDWVWKFNCDYKRKSDRFCVIAKTDTLLSPVLHPQGKKKQTPWKESEVKIKSSWQ